MESAERGIHAHWDCFGGATGSAMLGACLHAESGYRLARDIEMRIQRGLPGLHLKCLQVSKKTVAATMSATFVKVMQEGESAVTCTMKEIRGMLTDANAQFIPDRVCEQTEMVFTEMLKAQNVVHGHSLTDEQAEFSVECLVYVVATLLTLRMLCVETVSCGPLPLGEGSLWTEEGVLLPVPSPVTLQLLVGMLTSPGPSAITGDMVTPTAAALLRVLLDVSSVKGSVRRPSGFKAHSICIGADEEGGESRVLRLWLGEANSIEESVFSISSLPIPIALKARAIQEKPDGSIENGLRWKMDQLTQLEANLDDMTAEALAFAVEMLLDNGAVDAWVAPIVMKKGRAAHTLHCLCYSDDSITNKLLELVFRHTTTLGVRMHRNIDRAALRRSFLSVQTPFGGDVKVKVGYLGDEVVSVKAEFDDCARISRESNVPIQQVTDFSTQVANSQLQATKGKDCTTKANSVL